jgi:small subunit ribosomal protein S2
LQRNLGGIRGLDRLPDAIFVIDTKKEHIAVTEANKLGLPVVAVVDTNCDPDVITHVIPGNDDAIRSGALLCRVVADAVVEGRFIAQQRPVPPAASAPPVPPPPPPPPAASAAPTAAAAPTGPTTAPPPDAEPESALVGTTPTPAAPPPATPADAALLPAEPDATAGAEPASPVDGTSETRTAPSEEA